ncbi:hypothetical protein RHGRI_031017 [Rhododendron griersonianum]|uniref:Uncharacterized protein n=1 Tax=Rhododendron griersonianum TaxID=479676 RepID=A0AAV6I9N4_9ERIC|nr:hypothetical protein RHGRI_031017 [Rhododendron griersonianum]
MEKLEARAFKTASHLSLYQARRDKLEGLNKRMKWLEEEMQRVRDEIHEVSTDFQALEDEALKGFIFQITWLGLEIHNTRSVYHDDSPRVCEEWLQIIATSVLMMLSSWATAPRYRHISSHDVFMLG